MRTVTLTGSKPSLWYCLATRSSPNAETVYGLIQAKGPDSDPHPHPIANLHLHPTRKAGQQSHWQQSTVFSPTKTQDTVGGLSHPNAQPETLPNSMLQHSQQPTKSCSPMWDPIQFQGTASSLTWLHSTAWGTTQSGWTTDPSSQPYPTVESNQWHHPAKKLSLQPHQLEMIT